ncbi:MAG: tripartite tricarboxylate transporter substrate binding protein [Alphaproteobacteria bacterium]|nr:tripartite tricarboxylate transporter substrate binding protein [Alphaproteobacteria bacterium]
MKRRGFLVGAAALTVLSGVGPAEAQYTPSRPIDLVVHSGPGAGPDAFGRALIAAIEAEKISPVRIQINHKIGGGGATAASYIIEKKGDTNTIGLFTSAWIANPLVQADMKATVKEMTPVVRLVIEPAVFAVRADSPYKSMQEIVDAAKKDPTKIKQSGGSPLARDAIVRHVLMSNTGARWAFVSFPTGSERIAALLGGHVDMMIIEPSEAGELIRGGQMRALAQVSDKRLSTFPNTPTLREAGFNVPNVPQARGFVAPPDTPREVIAFYEQLFEKLVKSPTWQKYLTDNQFEDAFLKSEETGKFFDQYSDLMRGILTGAGIRVVR